MPMTSMLFDDVRFDEMEIRDAMSRVRAILAAVPKWEQLAAAEVDAMDHVDLSQMSELQRHWHGEYLNDQRFLLDRTKESLMMGVAVSLVASIENTLKLFCGERNVPEDRRNSWRECRRSLET